MKESPTKSANDRVMSAILTIGVLFAGVLLFYVTLRQNSESPLEPISLLSGEWSPYSGEKLPDQGVTTLIVNAVFNQMGYAPAVQFIPWPRAEEVAEQNENNQGVRGIYPYVKTSARERLFYYSDPIFEIDMAIFYNIERTPGLSHLEDIEGLEDVRILPVAGYQYPVELQPYIATALVAENDNKKAFQRLISDPQVEAVIEARLVGHALLHEHFPQHIALIQTTPLLFHRPIHLMASKRNPHNLRLIRDFNRILRVMNRDGRLGTLQRRGLRRIEQQHQVLLKPFSTEGFLFGYLDQTGSNAVALPNGTRALVVSWGRDFLQPNDPVEMPAAYLVRVQIINGPMRDQYFYVDGRAIVLPDVTQ
jgi:polar amino acid transport system substrate-binding protein